MTLPASLRPSLTFLKCWLRYDWVVADSATPFILTIDGPAASGKSSVARGVADALDIPFVSSGLLYRAATFLALQSHCDLNDEAALLALLSRHTVSLDALTKTANRVHIDGQEMTAALHTDDVDNHVSIVAIHPGLRQWVNARLREVSPPFVIEGRDMGTAVFPGARYKFYLTATPEVRAKRRMGERSAQLADMVKSLTRRDQLDHKQLTPAPDAVHIDTSPFGLQQVISAIVHQVIRSQDALTHEVTCDQ
jgi:CMP/dCMP kinase